jgi:hypothetical protein
MALFLPGCAVAGRGEESANPNLSSKSRTQPVGQAADEAKIAREQVEAEIAAAREKAAMELTVPY